MPPTTYKDYVGRSVSVSKLSAQGVKPHRFERALPLLIFILGYAYLCIFRHYSTLEPDEGIVLQGAGRILSGQIPYRDFFTFYTPGSFYVLAILFRLFGNSFAVARTSLAIIGAICSVITYLLARRVCSRRIAVAAAVLATTAGTAFRFLVLHNLYSTLVCCLCLYATVRFQETRKPWWAFAATSLASLTFLIEQSKGAGLYIGLGFGFLILMRTDGSLLWQKRAVLAAWVGLLWPLAITFMYFGAKHAAGAMVRSWLWPLQHYAQANHVPYGYQNWSDHSREVIFHSGPFLLRIVKVLAVSPGLLVPILPLVAAALLVYWMIELRRKRYPFVEGAYYVLVCAVLSGLLLSVVITRPDILHFMYLAPLWYLVIGWILGPLASRSRVLNWLRVPLSAFLVTTFGLLSIAILFAATGAHHRVETRRGAIITSEKDTVINYVDAHVAPDSELLVYPYLPLYNYLTQTHSPSRYDYLQPGMNTPDQAHEIVSALQSTAAPVLFEPSFAEKIPNSWPGTSLSAIVKDPVSDYIARHYRVCQALVSPEGWRFEFMVKKETFCP